MFIRRGFARASRLGLSGETERIRGIFEIWPSPFRARSPLKYIRIYESGRFYPHNRSKSLFYYVMNLIKVSTEYTYIFIKAELALCSDIWTLWLIYDLSNPRFDIKHIILQFIQLNILIFNIILQFILDILIFACYLSRKCHKTIKKNTYNPCLVQSFVSTADKLYNTIPSS